MSSAPPPGVARGVCSEAFLKAQAEGHLPPFSWYKPRFLPPPSSISTATVALSSSSSRDGEAIPFFPPLMEAVLSGRLDGEAHPTRLSPAEVEARKAAAGFAWEKTTSVEDLWYGPALSNKVPPATDYERLLLDHTEQA